ncbi:cation efflux family-domain-containing protein [Massariosphaeria phaeospora]|uniref:Cation efflux family-domain-containing protein n=1 Tax=Massariosphaeria phaeospora TaxID=100035 RepID=A0A7C8M3B5_9PLEO|nr:cation efflux family-domain-containing protein [Massariosphaeria phaeospora]
MTASTSTSTTQTRGHAGHSHGHHHGGDNVYLLSKDKKDAAVRITRIGLYVNLGMAVGKGFGGYVFNSQALIADAIHSLTDLVSDIMTLATVSWSIKPPSERFPSGYGKVESLGSLGVSGILLGGGLMMGWASIIALCQQFFPDAAEVAAQWGLLPHSHGHHHGAGDLGPNINAAWLAGGSILIKEWLYRATLKVAKERKSSVLASNAYHHRVDSLTAFVALLMIGGSNVLNNASWLDPVGGLVISLMVIQAGWGNTRASLFELADVGVEAEMRDKVRQSAVKALGDINTRSLANDVEVRTVQGLKSGQNYLMDVELAVPGSWSIEQTRGVEELVRERIGLKVRGVKKVRVRFVSKSSDEADVLDEFIGADVSAKSSPGAEEEHHDGHEHQDANGNGNARKRK